MLLPSKSKEMKAGMCVCNFNNVCFLPKENQYVKSPYKRFFFSFDKEEMCLLSSHAASGHVHFPNFMCIQKEGHVTGHSHSLEGYHKRPEMQKWPWHDCMKKSSVYRALKCPALCKFGDWSVATGIQELKSFSLNESTAVTFRLVKPWGNHNHEIWEMSLFAFTYTNICPHCPFTGTLWCLQY